MESIKRDRHCAFCLLSIPEDKVKICGRCHRRAYCSKECQVADWSNKDHGQRHKNWCALGVLEEDLDWKIVPVEGKGLGVIALRPISSLTRIMVDSALPSPEGHSGIADLMPKDGTPASKFRLNCLGCGEGDDIDAVLCLRMSRVNHSCDENASHVYIGGELKVKVLFAERDIQEGEEICISYKSFKDIVNPKSSVSTRSQLKMCWGVVCPKDCICYDSEIRKKVDEAIELDSQIVQFGSTHQPDRALRAVKRFMSVHEIINSSWMEKNRTLYDGFQIALMQRKTLGLAKEYIAKLAEIRKAITHPKDSWTEECLEWQIDFRTHSNYLELE